jgi:peptide/nickel transport system substrate-binding protein
MSRTFRGRRATVAALLAFGLIAGACGDSGSSNNAGGETGGSSNPTTTDAGKPVSGGSATVQLFSEIATLDPVKATGSGGSDGQRFFALYGALMALDAGDQKMDYLLADSFKSTSADFKTWELKLKPNLKFTDGSVFDAAAVKANWERCQVAANASPARGVCAFFTKMEVSPTDPLTLVSAAGLLLMVATLAAWVPARRASRVDPLTALRSD